MGNSQSSDVPDSLVSERGGSEASQRTSVSYAGGAQQRRKQPPPPNPATRTLVSTSSTSTVTSSTHAHAITVSASPQRNHIRARSATTGSSQLDSLYRRQKLDRRDSSSQQSANMGNADSKPQQQQQQQQHQLRPQSRSNTVPIDHTSLSGKKITTAEQSVGPFVDSASTKAVDVRRSPSPIHHDPFAVDDAAPAEITEPSSYTIPTAIYSRPPRLPLPIEEEVHTPGSPIQTPRDREAIAKPAETTILDQDEVEGALPRKSSVLSSNTLDDDEIGDNEAFANDAQWGEIRVPTTLEWFGEGEKIFVTGTFCNWEKKVKLHKNRGAGAGFCATVNLRPGTHHIKFLVDGEMMTSDKLPTTVDWTNILVNYIEIVAPLPSTADEKPAPVPATPMPIPGAAAPSQATGSTAKTVVKESGARANDTGADLLSQPHQTVTSKGDPADSISGRDSVPPAQAASHQQSHAALEPKKAPKKLPRPRYTNRIPDFLIDLDNFTNPEDERYRRAQRVSDTLLQPPSLPMFLSKSILNGSTPHKDDASVLVMPNHTVLNHLATSSIKGGVLATSGTTRYKRKFLTTIMYKPTSDDG